MHGHVWQCQVLWLAAYVSIGMASHDKNQQEREHCFQIEHICCGHFVDFIELVDLADLIDLMDFPFE